MRKRAGVVLFVVASLVSASCAWPLVRYGPARTGHNPAESRISPGNVAQLEPAWQVDLGTYPTHFVGSPLVADGNVLVPLISTSEPNSLHARDATSGEPRWSVTFGASPDNAPETLTPWLGVGGGVVYIGGLLGPETTTYGYAVPSGHQVFTAAPGAAISPVRIGDVVYATHGERSSGPTMYGWRAWDANNGAQLFGSASSSPLALGPTIADGVLYTWQNRRLEAYDASGMTNCGGAPKVCTPLWTAAETADGFSFPAVAHGLVYVKGGAGLRAYPAACDTPTCSPVWTGLVTGYPSTAAVSGDTAFIGASDGKLYAFDAAGCGAPTCAPRWTTTAATSGVIFPTIANNVVFVGTSDGNVIAYHAGGCGAPTCAPLWSTNAASGLEVQEVVVARGMVFVAAGATLRAFRLREK